MERENRSFNGVNWYALRTAPDREEEAAKLLNYAIPHDMWKYCRYLKKRKLFRSGGSLHLVEDSMFPGYLFIQTDQPKALEAYLQRARKLPQLLGDDRCNLIVPVENKDLEFLQNVCGSELEYSMMPTLIDVNHDNRIVKADGVLAFYLDSIEKLNLRKRYALVNVELFNRKQSVLFGICLPKDLE